MSIDESRQHIERAKKAYQAANLLWNGGLVEDAFSRAYYALVHLSFAMLLKVGESLPRTHSGLVARLWSLREKLMLDDETVRSISRFQAIRENGDYSPVPAVTQDDLRKVLKIVDKLFSTVSGEK